MTALVQLRGADCPSEAKETLKGTSMTASCPLTSIIALRECHDPPSRRPDANSQYRRNRRQNHVSDMSPCAFVSVKPDMRISPVKHKKHGFLDLSVRTTDGLSVAREAAAQFVAGKPLEGPEERAQARKEQRPGWLCQDTPSYPVHKFSATIAP